MLFARGSAHSIPATGSAANWWQHSRYDNSRPVEADAARPHVPLSYDMLAGNATNRRLIDVGTAATLSDSIENSQTAFFRYKGAPTERVIVLSRSEAA